MKKCGHCHVVKDEREFYNNKWNKDKLTNNCKECTKARVNEYHSRPGTKEKIAERERKRDTRIARRERDKNRYEKRKSNPRYIENRKKSGKKCYENNKQKIAAKGMVFCAIEKGIMQPAKYLNCEICGNKASQYHHYNGYEQKHWYDVIPVCVKCHSNIHHPLPEL